MDALRPVLTTVIAAGVTALAGYLYAKFGLDLDPATRDKLTEIFVTVFLSLASGGVAKVLASRKINPANAAKPSIVPTTSERAPGPTLRASAVVPEGETTGLEGQRRG